VVDKMRQNRLRWFGWHVMKREEMEGVKAAMKMNFEGKEGEEDQKRDRWIQLR